MDNPERDYCICDHCLKQPKEIKGYPNYLIYSDGRVFSKFGKGRFRKLVLDKDGYQVVKLVDKTVKVHRLVAEHFIYNYDDKPDVDHINRDRSDNRVKNLRWVTKSENSQNKSFHKKNKSGHTGISITRQNYYLVAKVIDRKKYGNRVFVNKIDAICYKYILLLKIKSNYYLNNGII